MTTRTGRSRRPQLEAFEDRWCPSGGLLNSGFGSGGIDNLPASAGNWVSAVTAQPNGDIVSVGTTGGTGQQAIAVVRTTPSGALDPTFNGSGVVAINVSKRATYGGAVLIQPDGKIVVGGFDVPSKFNAGDEEFVVARLNADGSLDKSFGHGGLFTWNASPGRDDVRGLALLGNGDILATGNTSSNGDSYALFRLTPAGALDTSFGQNGLAVAHLPSSNGGNSPAGSIVLAPNGGILLCGASDPDADVVAFTSQGILDTSFGGTGFVRYAPPAGYTGYSFAGIVLQGNQLVAAGSLSFIGNDGKTHSDGVVSRFSLAGTLDTTFGTNGLFITSFEGSFTAPVLEADSSIVLAGTENYALAGGGVGNEMVVSHLSVNGQADTTFGSGGSGFVVIQDGTSLQGTCLILDGSSIAIGGVTSSTSGVRSTALVELTES